MLDVIGDLVESNLKDEITPEQLKKLRGPTEVK